MCHFVSFVYAALPDRPVIFFCIFCPNAVFIENVTYILKSNFENFGKNGKQFKPKLQGLLGDGIFNADGKQWYAHRKTSAHLFKLNKFRLSILTIFNEDLHQVIEMAHKEDIKGSIDLLIACVSELDQYDWKF